MCFTDWLGCSWRPHTGSARKGPFFLTILRIHLVVGSQIRPKLLKDVSGRKVHIFGSDSRKSALKAKQLTNDSATTYHKPCRAQEPYFSLSNCCLWQTSIPGKNRVSSTRFPLQPRHFFIPRPVICILVDLYTHVCLYEICVQAGVNI